MAKYKDTNNKVHDIDPAFEHLLPAGCVQITDEEALALNPPVVVNPILVQIAEIEAQITPRRMREATLTTAGKTWLAGKDAEIAALRASL